MDKKFVGISGGKVNAYYEYFDSPDDFSPAELMEVTDRNDGPFIGKTYDPETDTFSDPPDPEKDE